MQQTKRRRSPCAARLSSSCRSVPRTKKKLGFPVPLNDWLREDKYYNKVKAAFQSDVAEKFFVTSELMKLLDDHKSGKALNMQKMLVVLYVYPLV